MQKLLANDKRITWNGAVSLEHGEGWVKPWRLPCNDLDLFPVEGLQVRAAMPAGVRICFATDSAEIAFHTEPAEDLTGGIKDRTNLKLDLYIDGKLQKSLPFKIGDMEFRFSELPDTMKEVELWLHQMVPFKLRGIELHENAKVEKSEDKRPRWITWGSSISHCADAESPSFTWPAVVAREKNLNLTCLGFGGQCHGEPMVARLIRDLPADIVSVKLGINIYGQGSLGPRTYRSAVLGIIATIRDGHPNIPLIICSPIWSPPRESTPSSAGITLVEMREAMEAAVESFRNRGDKNIYYVNGLNLFGPMQKKNLPDNLHPDAEGYKLLGKSFLHNVFDKQKVKLPDVSKTTMNVED